jgi:hypothetical protein
MARCLILACAVVGLILWLSPREASQAANPYVMQIDMHGEQMVPAVNSLGWGFVRFFFAQDRLSADYTVDVKGFSGSIVLGADIRRGLRGVNGPVIRHLADGGFITMGNHITFTQSDLEDMAKGGWYATLYTALHPEGEMRGQIILPADFRPVPQVASPSPPLATSGVATSPDDGAPDAQAAAIQSIIELAPLPGPVPTLASVPLTGVASSPQAETNTGETQGAAPDPAQAASSPAPAAPASAVVISPPNTGDAGLTSINRSPLIAALVGLATLIFGVGLMVLSGRI